MTLAELKLAQSIQDELDSSSNMARGVICTLTSKRNAIAKLALDDEGVLLADVATLLGTGAGSAGLNVKTTIAELDTEMANIYNGLFSGTETLQSIKDSMTPTPPLGG